MKNRAYYKPSNMSYDLDSNNCVTCVAPENAAPKQVHTKWWSPEQRAEIELTLTENEFLEIVARVPELLISYKLV